MKKKTIWQIVRFILLALFLLFAIFPLYWIILTSFKPVYELYTFPIKYWTNHPSLYGYKKLFEFVNFKQYFANSIFVSFIAAFISTIFAMLSGYILSRKEFKWRYIVILYLFFSQMIPSYLIMVPQYIMFSKFNLINKLISIIIVYSGFGAAFSTIMAKGFFDRIPKSIEEAALIDGCNEIQSLFKITVPLMLPGLSAILSFSFVNNWNELFTAVMFLNTADKYTVPVGLYSIVSKAGIQWNVLSAGIVIALLPTIIVFSIAQKYIISGLTQGSLKD
ncbi:carbohydrate ABC transporter membrane protein 2, CUT1 family (TC 3.A.1.1.-) [Marinitoga hydrogenitolerans DSM 16785]|uniref:Carbohydrate ABC transporter membrane protein 2, CUT1 family (TC 3.A.1.1.-) n=1 Tax=Marinitoga hydrogenitolerans (strain DSM 16785 / JCM 12826 / AT1271) TaxID=1122195 RepID=A0A1M4XFP5_MARH1|nr:carbohydrate ABC transporter permease [Marinitoga hydrogenitolerans]SHE92136.1 carbohydrate ABC transporter membrane protein 2, CUT1 family (TC 3.A.1.1.-) [Marinitoga hydrogenitolerans DSM 16785]